MEFAVLDNQGHKLAQGKSDNPYQVRNLLAQHMGSHPKFIDENTIHTHSGLVIRSTASVYLLMKNTPTVQENPNLVITQPQDKPLPQLPKDPSKISLKTLCHELAIPPSLARRILRKKFGANNVRYEWAKDEVPQIKKILLAR